MFLAMPRLDEDDLLGEIVTDENGYFQISGETKEWSWIDPAIELRIPFNYPTLATAKCCIYETWSNYGMKARVGRRLPKNYIQEGHFDPNLRKGYFDVGTIVVPTYLTGGTFSDDEIMWQKNWEGSCCFLPRMA
ncbi:transthyretin-like family domain-containing protein [Ditylenchus destructor]|nr:transthyretin-like family domain-containing protein [Ditylenchus destructor]